MVSSGIPLKKHFIWITPVALDRSTDPDGDINTLMDSTMSR